MIAAVEQSETMAGGRPSSHWAKRVVTHALLFCLCLVLVLLVRSTMSQSYNQERRRIEAEGRARREGQFTASWNKLHYTDVRENGFDERFLGALDWKSLRLSPIQKDRLREQLSAVMS